MPKTGPAHERPSWVSLALIVCSSLAVLMTGGWLAVMIMASKGGTADPVDALDDASLPPHVENTAPPYVPPVSALATMPAAAGGAAASDASAASAAPGAQLSSLGGASTSALATAPTRFGGPGDLLNVDPPEPAANVAVPESVPLPMPRRPRRTAAAVPVPRSRPRIDDAETQAPRGWSLFNLFSDRQH